MRTSRSLTAPSRSASLSRWRRSFLVLLALNAPSKTRQAARIRRVATRMSCRSSASAPVRVPASRRCILEKWKLRTLRAASGRLSSATTPIVRGPGLGPISILEGASDGTPGGSAAAVSAGSTSIASATLPAPSSAIPPTERRPLGLPLSSSGGAASQRCCSSCGMDGIDARIALTARASLERDTGRKPPSLSKTWTRSASGASSPRFSSTSSSSKESRTRPSPTTSTSSTLSSARVAPACRFRTRRSCRIVSSSTRASSPHSSRMIVRACETGQSAGMRSGSAGPSISSRRCNRPPDEFWALRLISVPRDVLRSRAANPERASAQSPESTYRSSTRSDSTAPEGVKGPSSGATR